MSRSEPWSTIAKSLLTPSNLVKLALIFLAYLVTAYVGLKIAPVSHFATLVWAPTGISLAALLVFGYRFFPAITLAAFSINYLTGASLEGAIGISIGNTLEALAGSYLLNKFGFDKSLEKTRDVLKLIFFAAILSSLISPVVGVATLYGAGVINAQSITSTWSAWWVGDMLSDLVIAPILLTTWINWRKLGERLKLFELVLWLGTVLIVSIYVFYLPLFFGDKSPPITYLIYPPLIWGVVRFKQPFVALGVAVILITAVVATSLGHGPFTVENPSTSLLLLSLFMGVISSSFLIFSAVVSEYWSSRREVLQLNESLAKKVGEVERLNGLMVSYIKQDRQNHLSSKTKRDD